ncbi:PriCT-2 domain-containing protein [Myroides marinus]|uniref:BT4734/BF3469 family protein n=1 Tax=Myroides marinus TaxID=703342 RepID=UPI002575EF7E|nr:BT4734/BF3469 family protein [Myroides marinus]MDM1391320.1 PriCT-2 domain-containing protein [Myroides marinus]
MNHFSTNELFNIMVSYQSNTIAKISSEVTLENVLDTIKNEKLVKEITRLRVKLNQGDKDFYNANKKHLPSITFSGLFNVKRRLVDLKKYNSLIVIDIDKLEDNEIENVYNKLLEDNYVFSFWRSPSDRGFKGLVYINYEITNICLENYQLIHKKAFSKLSKYFIDKHNIELDSSGSDITRLCFYSSDKNLVLKENYTPFYINDLDLLETSKKDYIKTVDIRIVSSRDALYNPQDRNNPRNRKTMSSIIKYLERKNKSITLNYKDWYEVAMSIANEFTYDIGVKYFNKLSKLDSQKYNEIECSNFLMKCYENRKGGFSFASIIFLATKQGYKDKNN